MSNLPRFTFAAETATTLYDRFAVCVLDQVAHLRTCNCWFTVSSQSMAHVAFRTEAGLLRWLNERGLHLTEPLTPAGTYSVQTIAGQYYSASHLDRDRFFDLDPLIVTWAWSNGQPTLIYITVDARGVRTAHHLNPNIHDRVIFSARAANACDI